MVLVIQEETHLLHLILVQLIAKSFNMEAGNIYEISFYRNRVGGTDMGIAQFTFYDENGEEISSDPSSLDNIHTATGNNVWEQYSQTVTVPNNATDAQLKLYGAGTNSYVYFDEMALSFVSAGNTYLIGHRHTVYQVMTQVLALTQIMMVFLTV